MKVILSYCHRDYNLAFYGLRVLLDKTDFPAENLILYASQHAPVPDKALSSRIGAVVQCNGDEDDYPLGANQMFTGAMRLMQRFDEPTLLCEADSFPTCQDWYYRVRDEHLSKGTLCSGSFVDWTQPKHFNGNMVIHPDCLRMHPSLGRVTYEAWDVFHAEWFRDHGAQNKEILNAKRDMRYYPTQWWWNQTQRDGHRPAWIHGCQTFQMWEHIERNGFNDETTN